ncbi:MAG: GNAT family N-acetyltransferase, partial [Oscillospiraceae bacterium]|nr:GNAT family N-acetyltransferase [Oscillospiraceae bacterium]
MIIETERLILRPWREDEAEKLFAYASDPRIGPNAGWPPHASVGDSLAAIRRMNALGECYAVVPKTDGEPAGCIGLSDKRRGPMRRSSAELGFWIGAEHWGRGYATEA